jgi:hypothetical protein
MRFLSAIGFLIVCQYAGLMEVMRRPWIPKLRRTWVNDNEGWSSDGDYFNLQLNYWSWKYGWTSTIGITVVDVKTEPKIYRAGSSSFLYTDPYQGSGAIGVVIFSLPTIILLSPVWLIHNMIVKLFERHWEMNHRHRKVLSRLRKILDKQEYKAVKAALLNYERGKRK